MSENDFNSVPLNQRPQLETLVSSQAVTALQAQLTAAQQRVAELERREAETYAKYCTVMEAVKRSRMEHGDCKSGKRYGGKPLACTACMAQLELDELISEFKGRRITLA